MPYDRHLTLAAGVALALVGGSAIAADLPSRKAPPPVVVAPPPPLWTGFYGGLNAGYVFDGSTAVTHNAGLVQPIQGDISIAAGLPASLSVNTSGFIGGGQVGYNWQFHPNFVAGLEADFQGRAGSSASASAIGGGNVDIFPNFAPNAAVRATLVTKESNWLGTVRGRLGFLVTPTVLLYATGGLAYGDAKLSSNTLLASPLFFGLVQTDTGGASYSDTRVGYTVGGGAEWMFLPNWSAKLEYLYYDLGSANVNYVTTSNYFFGFPTNPFGPTLGVQASSRYNGHIVRVGVNYHFNFAAPAPVLAKY